MLDDYPKIKKRLIEYWEDLYLCRYYTSDKKMEIWGYSSVHFVPIGSVVQKMLFDGKISDGAYCFLVKCISSVKRTELPLDCGGTFIDRRNAYFKKNFKKTTFFKYRKELVELNILLDFTENYYVFNPKYLNTIRKVRKQREQSNFKND